MHGRRPRIRWSGSTVASPLWVGLPVVLGLHLAFSSFVSHPSADAFAQVVYLLGPSLFATFATAAAWAGEPRSRARLVWSLMAALAWGLLAADAVVGYDVFGGGLPTVWNTVVDVVDVAMVALFVALMVTASGLDRMGGLRVTRILLEALAMTAALLVTVHWALYLPALGRLGVSPGTEVGIAAYVALGVVAFVANGFAYRLSRVGHRVWDARSSLGVAVLSVAIVVWGVTGSPHAASPVGDMGWPTASAALLAGYYALFVAAYHRVSGSRDVRHASQMIRDGMTGSPTLGLVSSSLMFASSVWLGYLVISPLGGAQAKALQTGALIVVVVAMVSKTILESLETDLLVSALQVDRELGVEGSGGLTEALVAMFGEMNTSTGFGAVFLVDIDDLRGVNSRKGLRYGDAVLRSIAQSIVSSLDDGFRVFRLSGDEFVIAGPVTDETHARRIGRSLVNDVARAGSVDAVTASVGCALYPVHGDSAEQIIKHAEQAQVWVKRHGKNGLVIYDRHVGQAIELEERFGEDEASRTAIVRALSAALDARDPASRHHSRNVAALARMMAEQLALEPDHVRRVEIAGMLHDIGKIALPDVVVGERGHALRGERLAREHSVLGERITRSLGVEGLSTWIRSHHERWDGNGYPDGLTGEDIPLESRIITLADAYDGMTSGKRYGAPMSRGAALQELDLGMGTRFDPDLAERFIRLIAGFGALGWSDDSRGVE